ncbi:MAG: sigma-54 dependent transcriptional regulator, partial [Gemmatimonadales bacterium]
GKDLVARAIHARSRRRDRPFLEINCTSLPEHLLESELFGHERGAFTDAHNRKKGLAELADGGTLLLDEIGDMPLNAQAKLLRFLESSTFKRLGGTSDLSVDIRVIAATNRDLEEAVEARAFRSDLYFRLNVVPLYMPTLRERRDDIGPLAVYFVERLAHELKRDPPKLTAGAVEVLESCRWPGNVRELRNLLERILILEDTDEIRAEHLTGLLTAGREVRGDGGADDAVLQLPAEGVRLEDVERRLIAQALDRTGGNVTQAARLLGVSRDTLRYRLGKRRS